MLCCLTYEYDSYRKQRKGMPKVGRKIKIGNEIYRIKRQNPLQQSLVVSTSEGDERLLSKEQWAAGELLPSDKSPKKNGRRSSPAPETDGTPEDGGDTSNTRTS